MYISSSQKFRLWLQAYIPSPDNPPPVPTSDFRLFKGMLILCVCVGGALPSKVRPHTFAPPPHLKTPCLRGEINLNNIGKNQKNRNFYFVKNDPKLNKKHF
jgi:hypothetical protein